MKLRQLQYFFEVGELESVTKAAERLNIAQPAISRQLRSLEQDIGVRLFNREGRGIVLTNAGLVFRDRVRTVLRELDLAQIEMKALSRSPGGRIDVGLPYSISQALTRALVDRMHDEVPGVAMRVIDGWSGFIIEWLVRGRLDLGVIYDHTLKSNVLRIEPLAEEEHYLVCARKDPLARREEITLAEVSRLPLVLPSREHGLRVAVEKFMSKIGCAPTIQTELESIVGLKQMTQQGKVYTILPRGEIEAELAASLVSRVRIIEPTIYRKLFIARSNQRPATAPMKAVLNVVKEETEKLIKAGAWASKYLG